MYKNYITRLLSEKRLEKAILVIQKGMELFPQDSYYNTLLSLVYLDTNELDKAEKEVQRVEKLYRESEGLCELTKKSTLLGFWMNKDIIIGDVYREDADLIISRHRLNLEVVKDLNGEVLVYRP